ncbi:Pimeloyl-ACP methyl ester carboxylesterase [Devosia crocina]|uniref:Pimeloyl-ACP methyl ester carboxylesterase n=1 Tax=Devosia crocina TaxID=429728 RepID=A0A1I7NRN1_9HYPH|nr:alpha/beta hydrolase [Devosia crocina]SFV37341.1 Pimeloyl-ACP methyl ester carboxylesterase [Devosia crocina]
MPLFFPVRVLTTLVSLLLLAATVYLLWSWYDGHLLVERADGDVEPLREDWRLWTGLLLLGFSFLGRLVVVPLLARPDRDEPSVAARGTGEEVAGPMGTTLFIETLGRADGPTLILTHGWSMDSTIWHYAKRQLGQHFRLIVWDLPGLGRSRGPISLETFAACLAFIIERSGAPGVVLVGHSIGGMTIQTLARDFPDLVAQRVRGMVLFNTTYTNPLRTMILPRLMQALRWPVLEPLMRLTILLQPLAWLGAWQSYLSGMAHLGNRIGFGRYVTRSQLEHVTLLSTRNSQGSICRGNLAMFRWDATGVLAHLPVPVLAVAGAADIVTKPEASQAIVGEAAEGRLIEIAGVNHMGMLERAEAYNEAVAAFASAVFVRDGVRS